MGPRAGDVAGKPFDPSLHDALMQVVRGDVPPHTVIEEVEKGKNMVTYTMEDIQNILNDAGK